MQGNKYRPDIDGLRAIAVLSVIVFHAFPHKLPGGFIGVDIFFVISGFLITKIIRDELQNDSFSIFTFYLRRITRIFPALILMLLATFSFGWFFLLTDEYAQLSKHVSSASIFISNLVLIGESGYFDNSSDTKPLLHLWSLGIEEQFYIFWPWLIFFAIKRRLKMNAIILVVGGISFLLSIYFLSINSTYVFYSPVTRCWELLCGAYIAWIHYESKATSTKNIIVANFQSIVGLAFISIGIYFFKDTYSFPGWWAILPVLGATLLILAGMEAWINKNILGNKILVWIGLISYPLYLWHWPLLAFAKIIEGKTPRDHIRFQLIIAAFFLAYLTYRLVEKPIRSKEVTKLKALILSSLMIIIGIIGFAFYSIFDGVPDRAFPQSVNPEFVKAVNDWDFPNGLKERQINNIKYLTNSDLPPDILFIGDSHIEQFSPRVVYLTNNGLDKSIAMLTTSGSPPLGTMCKLPANECGSSIDKSLQLLESLDTVKKIVIGFCWNCYFIKDVDIQNGRYFFDGKTKEMFFGGNGKEKSLFALQELLQGLSKKYEVFLLLDNPDDYRLDPKYLINPDNLSNRFHFNSLKKSEKVHYQLHFEIDKKQKELNEELIKIGGRSGVRVIDQLPSLCPNGVCRILSDGKPINLDGGHLRPFFVIEQADYIDKVFK
jgi:peptidoglycan/LPS O-acetylase OafA/YrhL